MKPLLILLPAVMLFSTTLCQGTETAQVRLDCLSLQFHEATANDSYGFQWRLDVSTLPSGINEELRPYFLNTNYTHSAYVEIDSELLGTETGAIYLDVPGGGDANGDGIPDFFEVSQAVNGLNTDGGLKSPTFYSAGTAFVATWNRAAGSSSGTCTFQVYDPSNPYNSILFSFPFTLIQYGGPLTYTPGPKMVSGTVNLTQAGNSANRLQGPVVFVKSISDPANLLTLQAGEWTNATMQTLSFHPDGVERQAPWPTNYYDSGGFVFDDGDLSTSTADYQVWILSIDDTNDANHNGIPDFSDAPHAVVPPPQPLLSLSRTATNLVLVIHGATNHLHEIQHADSLSVSNWQPVLSVTLTNDPQQVFLPLPAPSAPATFWRVLAK